jgi:hypothetical protein
MECEEPRTHRVRAPRVCRQPSSTPARANRLDNAVPREPAQIEETGKSAASEEDSGWRPAKKPEPYGGFTPAKHAKRNSTPTPKSGKRLEIPH